MNKIQQAYINGALTAFKQAGLSKEAAYAACDSLIKAAELPNYSPEEEAERQALISKYEPKILPYGLLGGGSGALGGLAIGNVFNPLRPGMTGKPVLLGSLLGGALGTGAGLLAAKKGQNKYKRAPLDALRNIDMYTTQIQDLDNPELNPDMDEVTYDTKMDEALTNYYGAINALK